MRPRINTIRYKDWTHQDGSTTRGIAMYHKTQRVAQLTAAEAYELADNLVDLAEQLETQP